MDIAIEEHNKLDAKFEVIAYVPMDTANMVAVSEICACEA